MEHFTTLSFFLNFSKQLLHAQFKPTQICRLIPVTLSVARVAFQEQKSLNFFFNISFYCTTSLITDYKYT